MRHRIYLDTHFIHYLWDHKDFIWEQNFKSIREARVVDKSNQIEEYLGLGVFPTLCWLNEWRIIIGEFVLKELEQIPDAHRRNLLLSYAEQLSNLRHQLPDDSEDRETFEEEKKVVHLVTQYMSAIARMSPKDRQLLKEATDLACDIFLTTDSMLLKQARMIEHSIGLKIRKFTEFLGEETSQGRVKFFGDNDIRMFPDLLLYTGLISEIGDGSIDGD